jgi:hypothetical protein
MSAQDADIDSTILSLTDRRRKVQRIVSTIATDYNGWGDPSVTQDTVAARVAVMVKEGRLIAFGDLKDRRATDIVAPDSIEAKDF